MPQVLLVEDDQAVRDGLAVTKHGAPVSLAPTELKLLLELSASPGRVLSRQQLLESVWDQAFLGDFQQEDVVLLIGAVWPMLVFWPSSPRVGIDWWVGAALLART